MSTTTQILFNSPALHSLKRDQLVKLCKIHSLKASGKNKDLIERLRLHAKTLPPDDPLSVATRSENTAPDSGDESSNHSEAGHTPTSNNISRPSEQWEVVMDTITEVDEETLRSNRGASDRPVGEFGTHTSKGLSYVRGGVDTGSPFSSILPASVTSSLKAIANSLGLKRNPSKTNGTTSSSSSLSTHGTAQSSSTLPTSDPNGGHEEPLVEPVPGQSNLQGLPAPSDARLSLSQAPATTTIRLVSNSTTNPDVLLSPPKLQPFATSFDLVPDTPGGAGTSSVPAWPLSPGGAARESLYPPVPTFQGFGGLLHSQKPPRPTQYDNSDMDIDLDMPSGLAVPFLREPTPENADTSPRFNTGATPKSIEKPSAEPADIFSPAPKPQNTSTHSRLGIPKSEPFLFGSPLPQHNTSNLQFRTAAQSVLDEMNKRLVEEGVETVDASVLDNRRITAEDTAGKQETKGPVRAGDMFDRIHQREFDKMDSITSHYAAKRGVQSSVLEPILSKKRKSSLVVKERKPGVPPTRHRPNGSRIASGTSLKMIPSDFSEEPDEDEELTNRRASKRPRVERDESDTPARADGISLPRLPDPEEEARKQKEREAIRRKLEHNKAKRRSSMGRPSLGRAPSPKAKPTRFGFFASAKSLVQTVWNRGGGSKAPSNIPFSRPAQETKPKIAEAQKTAVIPGSSGAPSSASQTKRIPSGGSNTSVQTNASVRSTLVPPVTSSEGGGAVTSSRIWKSPTPSSNPPGSSVAANPKSSTVAGHGQSNNRVSSLVGCSSLGTRAGLSANNVRVSSMGAKSNIKASTATLQKQVTAIPRSRTMSTLMAPTASSLAKMNSYSRIPVPSAAYNENGTVGRASSSSKQRLALSPQPSVTLEQVTNSPTRSARPDKVFSQPLSPPPARPPASLTTVTTSIVGRTTAEKPSSSPSKPAVPSSAKVLPGRRPRISRSKVIARLASQRAVGASSNAGAGTNQTGGRVRSSMGAQAAGKTRQPHGGAWNGDVLMSAKKRVRQSEHARRRSRATAASDAGRRMEVD